MKVEVSLGEAVDRISILRLKCERIQDPIRRGHAEQALAAALADWRSAHLPEPETLEAWVPLHDLNGQLWDVEDALRDHERRGDFGPGFVEFARSVYRLNDGRARWKRAVDRALGSGWSEVKSYDHS